MIDDLAAAQHFRHRVEVAAIVLIKFCIGRDVDEFATEQRIAADDVVTQGDQAFGKVAAEEACDAADEDAHDSVPVQRVSVARNA